MSDLAYLEKIINHHYQVDLRSKSRNRVLIDAKRAFSYIAREIYGLGYQIIANHFQLNHSTIVFHVKTFKNLYETNESFSSKYNELSIDKIKISGIDSAIEYHKSQIEKLIEKKSNIIYPKTA